MVDMKCGYWMADGLLVNVIIGYVPDFLLVLRDPATTPQRFEWMKIVADHAIAGQYGIQDQSTGDYEPCATATAGIVEFNSSPQSALIESPIAGVGMKAEPVRTWAVGITPVARSADAIGTLLRPVTKNGYIYECTALTGIIAGAEPTWPTTAGETVVDDDNNTWTCRHEQAVIGGGQGFSMGHLVEGDGELQQFVAIRTERDKYLGDAANGPLFA